MPATPSIPHRNRLAGLLLIGITALVILRAWFPDSWAGSAASILVVTLLLLFAFQVRLSRLAFILVGTLLSIISFFTLADWQTSIAHALGTTAFIAAFFTALSTLRNAAGTSQAIVRCSRFLSQQPPGRRYAALTVGGQLFALLLNYGAITLLGSLATADARHESNVEIRNHRIRRMLLAIQRGFLATLPWSPLSFAVAISTAVIPGASLAEGFLPCLVNGVVIAGTGWLLDTLFKPRLSSPAPPRGKFTDTWFSVTPLLLLLALLAVVVGSLYLATGMRIVFLVLLSVPLIALG
ncbi:hypothetical protein, partial [Sedimenticola sp.]|uniref:hypothetical protein n=1 Tax=Sedimenticola sp. TaxID=1940285 RepID=UPI003D0E37F5